MKIKKIGTRNFKNAPDMELPLDTITVLLGENGKGKSSLLHSLSYVLNGTSPDDPIRHGEEYMSVMAVLDDGQNTKIERIMCPSDAYQINGKEEKEKSFLKEVQKLHTNAVNHQEELLIGSHSNDYFLDKDDSILWKFLETGKLDNARIHGTKELEVELADGTTLYMRKSQPSKVMVDGKKVTAKVANEMIEKRMQGDGKGLNLVISSKVLSAMENGDFSKYLISMIPMKSTFQDLANMMNLGLEQRKVLEPLFPLAPAPVSVSHIASAYKTLFTARTEVARQMETWKKKSDYSGQLPIIDKDTVKKRLNEAQGKLGAAKQIESAWDVYEKRIQERENSTSTLKEWTNEYLKIEDVRPIAPDVWNQLLAEEERLGTNINAKRKQKGTLENQKRLLMDMLENLNTSRCPLCDKLTCTTDKSSVRQDLENSLQEITESISESEGEIQTLESELQKLLDEKERLNYINEIRKKKVDAYEKIMQFKATIPEVPVKPDAVPDITELEKESERCSRYLEECALYEDCQNAEKQYKEFQEIYELYNGLVKLCEPKKGALTQMILSVILDPFKNHCNTFLKSIYGGYEIVFEMTEEGLKVLCTTKNNPSFTSVDALSKGEKMLVVLALMDMVSSITNSRMICFDDMEQFDTETIELLMKLLIQPEIMERYDHILLAPVNHKSISDIFQKYSLQVSIVNL